MDCTNGTSVDEESKLLPKLLKKINGHTDEQQFEIMMFLSKGLQLRDVSKADSVSSLYRALESGYATHETAVALLQYLLDKASVDRECTRQLSTYTSGTHDIAELQPRLYFRVMLLRVSEEMGSDDFVRFCNTVEHKLEANVKNFKSPLAVFQRLIEVRALEVTKESVEQLKQWLVDSGRQNIAREIVQKYRETHLEHSEPGRLSSVRTNASLQLQLCGKQAREHVITQNQSVSSEIQTWQIGYYLCLVYYTSVRYLIDQGCGKFKQRLNLHTCVYNSIVYLVTCSLTVHFVGRCAPVEDTHREQGALWVHDQSPMYTNQTQHSNTYKPEVQANMLSNLVVIGIPTYTLDSPQLLESPSGGTGSGPAKPFHCHYRET